MTVLRRLLHAVLAAAGLLAAAGNAQAVEIAAPYVPTAPSVVERMLDIAKVGPDDHVIDLGSGDGRIVITAARKHGARGFGIEIDPQLVAQANANARAAGVGDRVSFREGDLFATDLSQATVITIYLLKRATMKLRSGLFELKPGTRIVSNAASMGDWKPDHFEILDVKDKVRPDAPSKTYIHFWIVPAKVAGTWRWSTRMGTRTQVYELSVSQQFQMLSGTLRVGGKEVTLEEGKLRGDRITLGFTAEVDGKPLHHRLAGRVAGRSIVGTASVEGGRPQGEVEWKAIRATSPEAASRPGNVPAQ
jgi:precorrin-6B methylase 2